jgi:hypothetical protein
MLSEKITPQRILSALFLLFSVYWFASMNRYAILYYQEQTQLFVFSRFYFHAYSSQVGGILLYISSFITQFNYFPWMGGIVYGAAIWAISVLFAGILEYYKIRLGTVFLVFPAACMLFATADINFRLFYTIGILLILSGFAIYLRLSAKQRAWGAMILLAVIYAVGGGNMYLFLVLILSDLFLVERGLAMSSKVSRALIWIALSLLVPYCAWRFFYVVPLREAFLEGTPWNLFYSNYLYMAAWITMPVILWAGLITGKKKKVRAERKLLPFHAAGIVFLLLIGTGWSYNKQANLTLKMSQKIEQEDWETVLALSKNALHSELNSYFTNISLYKTGRLSEQMFHHKQVGASGLLLGKKNGYFNRYAMGILFYHLGIPAEAKHCAFEAQVGNSIFKEPGAQTLKCLVLTSIIQRNSSDFEKYIRFFEHSLFYTRWATQQRSRMQQALQNPAQAIPGLPPIATFRDFFINYKHLHSALLHLLEDDPNNQFAFEYLMAYYLLQKDFGAAKTCLETHYFHFDYPQMPAHWQEFLALYYSSHPVAKANSQLPLSENFAAQYEQFRLLVMAPANEEIRALLQARYGNTYWFYTSFTPVSTHNNDIEYDSKTIY